MGWTPSSHFSLCCSKTSKENEVAGDRETNIKASDLHCLDQTRRTQKNTTNLTLNHSSSFCYQPLVRNQTSPITMKWTLATAMFGLTTMASPIVPAPDAFPLRLRLQSCVICLLYGCLKLTVL